MIGMDNNAKGEDQKQETSIQRLKKQYPGLNVASGRFGHKKIGVNRFVVQEADGLRFVEEKDNAFVLIQKVSWSELPQRLYMDKLFMKAFYYTDEKEEHSVFTISRTDDGDAICAEVQKRKQVTVKKRKAIQRIVGFRSGSIWKSAIAVSVYAFMLFFVIGFFVGNDDEAVAKPASETKSKIEVEKERRVPDSGQLSETKKSKQDGIKSLYKKLGNNYIFKTSKIEKNESAIDPSHHTINLRVTTDMGTPKQIHSQAQHLAASILKGSLDKDKKIDQLALFVDDNSGMMLVKYVYDQEALKDIKNAQTTDGFILKKDVERLASSVTLHPDIR